MAPCRAEVGLRRGELASAFSRPIWPRELWPQRRMSVLRQWLEGAVQRRHHAQHGDGPGPGGPGVAPFIRRANAEASMAPSLETTRVCRPRVGGLSC